MKKDIDTTIINNDFASNTKFCIDYLNSEYDEERINIINVKLNLLDKIRKETNLFLNFSEIYDAILWKEYSNDLGTLNLMMHSYMIDSNSEKMIMYIQDVLDIIKSSFEKKSIDERTKFYNDFEKYCYFYLFNNEFDKLWSISNMNIVDDFIIKKENIFESYIFLKHYEKDTKKMVKKIVEILKKEDMELVKDIKFNLF